MNKIFLSLLALLLGVLTFNACKNKSKNQDEVPQSSVVQDYRRLDVEEFKKVLADTSIVLVDVRTPEEHAKGCIPGTDYNIDVLNENFTSKSLSLLKEGSTIAVYCRSGRRSQTAAHILLDYGFKVIELSSGFNGWTESVNTQK